MQILFFLRLSVNFNVLAELLMVYNFLIVGHKNNCITFVAEE